MNLGMRDRLSLQKGESETVMTHFFPASAALRVSSSMSYKT
jgi:hypothetical protein